MVVFNGIEFGVDGSDYHLIDEALNDIVKNNVPGITCEFGTREGGSLAVVLNALTRLGDTNRRCVSVDPWGNILYQTNQASITRLDYSNQMKKRFMRGLAIALESSDLDVLVLPMEDIEYMKRFADYVPFYNIDKKECNTYAFVFIDGPHSVERVLKESEFFATRMSLGGYILYDNVDYYPHHLVHECMLGEGFVEVSRGTQVGKILYRYEGISEKKEVA